MSGQATILVIDDDPLVRRAFVRLLKHSHFTVESAEDGRQGLRQFQQARPDAVLLDLRMPEMDGLEVLPAIVEQAPEVPVIVVSGEGTMHDAVEALRRGAWDYVTKPVFDPAMVTNPIERALEKAALLEENRRHRHNLERMNSELTKALSELRADQQAGRLLQFQLLPPDRLHLGRYCFTRRLFPSQYLSGDFIDYFSLGKRFAGFYVADVSGHGAASAIVTAMLRTLVGKHRQAWATSGDETALHPDELLGALDRDLGALDLDKHVTMFYGVLDLETGTMCYGNAGLFPYPILVEGNEALALETPGPPLGLMPSAAYPRNERRLADAGRIVIASDGVLELWQSGSVKERLSELTHMTRKHANIGALLGALELDDDVFLDDDATIFVLSWGDDT